MLHPVDLAAHQFRVQIPHLGRIVGMGEIRDLECGEEFFDVVVTEHRSERSVDHQDLAGDIGDADPYAGLREHRLQQSRGASARPNSQHRRHPGLQRRCVLDRAFIKQLDPILKCAEVAGAQALQQRRQPLRRPVALEVALNDAHQTTQHLRRLRPANGLPHHHQGGTDFLGQIRAILLERALETGSELLRIRPSAIGVCESQRSVRASLKSSRQSTSDAGTMFI